LTKRAQRWTHREQENKEKGRGMAESRRGVSLQMQMLIGFIVGLTAG
jgi:hypothetical protein